MGNAGKRNSIPKAAAAAVSWRGWGSVSIPLQSPIYPLGAVVVLSHTPGTGSTGHVGFFDSRLPDGRVQLLGGNQHDSVNKTPFPAARVAAVRWDESVVPSAIAAGKFKVPVDIPADRHQFADIALHALAFQIRHCSPPRLPMQLRNRTLIRRHRPAAVSRASDYFNATEPMDWERALLLRSWKLLKPTSGSLSRPARRYPRSHKRRQS
jgi:hypothetical protein